MKNFLLIVTAFNRVLLHKVKNCYRLPLISTRQKDESDVLLVNQEIRKKINISGLVINYNVSKDNRSYLVETLDNKNTPPSYSWLDIDTVMDELSMSKENHNLLQRYRTQSGCLDANSYYIWSQKGWLSHVMMSCSGLLDLDTQLKPKNLIQIRTWGLSTTIKILHNGNTYYFKAVNKLLAHEVKLSSYLYKKHPSHLPEILAKDYKQNFFIAEDLKGKPLSSFKKLDHYLSGVTTYAKLQIYCINNTQELKDLLVPQRDLIWLMEGIDRVLRDNHILTAGRGGGLNIKQISVLQGLLPHLKSLIYNYKALELPYSLEHGDLHANNIIIKEDKVYYIDWSHSSISIPFISLQNLIFELRDKFDLTEFSILEQAYSSEWYSLYDKEKIDTAIKYSKTIFFLIQAVSHYELYYALESSARTEVAGAVSHYLKFLLEHYEGDKFKSKVQQAYRQHRC